MLHIRLSESVTIREPSAVWRNFCFTIQALHIMCVCLCVCVRPNVEIYDDFLNIFLFKVTVNVEILVLTFGCVPINFYIFSSFLQGVYIFCLKSCDFL